MHSQKYKNKQSGFTILELMIVIAIIGITTAIAFPSYTTMTKNNCLTTKTNTLVTYIQLARSEAIKRQQNVTISRLNNDWANGLEITDVAGTTIREYTYSSCDTTTVTGTANSLTYTSKGFVLLGGTFSICDDRTGEQGRQITVNSVGRPNTNSHFGCS